MNADVINMERQRLREGPSLPELDGDQRLQAVATLQRQYPNVNKIVRDMLANYIATTVADTLEAKGYDLHEALEG